MLRRKPHSPRGGARWQPRVVALADPAVDLDQTDPVAYSLTLDEDLLELRGQPTWWTIRALTTPEFRACEHAANAHTDYQQDNAHITRSAFLEEAAFGRGVVCVENWIDDGDKIEGVPLDIYAEPDPDDPRARADIDPYYISVVREIGAHVLRLTRGRVGRREEGDPDPKESPSPSSSTPEGS